MDRKIDPNLLAFAQKCEKSKFHAALDLLDIANEIATKELDLTDHDELVLTAVILLQDINDNVRDFLDNFTDLTTSYIIHYMIRNINRHGCINELKQKIQSDLQLDTIWDLILDAFLIRSIDLEADVAKMKEYYKPTIQHMADRIQSYKQIESTLSYGRQIAHEYIERAENARADFCTEFKE